MTSKWALTNTIQAAFVFNTNMIIHLISIEKRPCQRVGKGKASLLSSIPTFAMFCKKLSQVNITMIHNWKMICNSITLLYMLPKDTILCTCVCVGGWVHACVHISSNSHMCLITLACDIYLRMFTSFVIAIRIKLLIHSHMFLCDHPGEQEATGVHQ